MCCVCPIWGICVMRCGVARAGCGAGMSLRMLMCIFPNGGISLLLPSIAFSSSYLYVCRRIIEIVDVHGYLQQQPMDNPWLL